MLSCFEKNNYMKFPLLILVLIMTGSYLKTKNSLMSNLLVLEMFSVLLLAESLLLNLNPLVALVMIFFLVTTSVSEATLGLSLLVIFSRKTKLLMTNKLF